jgi:TM2 domain-containing membrane protein YozV
MSRRLKYNKGRSRNVAIFLSLFLGWVGIQKYYIGSVFMGVLCSIFAFTSIPFFLGLLDVVRFALMTDDEFDAKYNTGPYPVHRTKYGTIVFKKDEKPGNQSFRPFRDTVPSYTKPDWSRPEVSKGVSLSSNSNYRKGNELFEKYSIKEALIAYRAALKESPNEAEIYFKMACCNAILEQKKALFGNVQMAIRCGFSDWNQIRTNDELAYFRIQPEYDKINESNFTIWPEVAEEESDYIDVSTKVLPPKNEDESKNVEINEGEPELSTDEILVQLKELGDLHQKGVLSDTEFNMQRRKLLA